MLAFETAPDDTVGDNAIGGTIFYAGGGGDTFEVLPLDRPSRAFFGYSSDIEIDYLVIATIFLDPVFPLLDNFSGGE